jgi:hypothetical protein
LKLVRRLFPVSTGDHGQKFFVRQHGRFAVTPLFIVLVFIEWSDLVFAIDSIPAVLAVTKDSSIAYTLRGVMEKFHHLRYGLSAILLWRRKVAAHRSLSCADVHLARRRQHHPRGVSNCLFHLALQRERHLASGRRDQRWSRDDH